MSWMSFSLLVLGTPGWLLAHREQPCVTPGCGRASPSSSCAEKFREHRFITWKIKSNPSSLYTCILVVESCSKCRPVFPRNDAVTGQTLLPCMSTQGHKTPTSMYPYPTVRSPSGVKPSRVNTEEACSAPSQNLGLKYALEQLPTPCLRSLLPPQCYQQWGSVLDCTWNVSTALAVRMSQGPRASWQLVSVLPVWPHTSL